MTDLIWWRLTPGALSKTATKEDVPCRNVKEGCVKTISIGYRGHLDEWPRDWYQYICKECHAKNSPTHRSGEDLLTAREMGWLRRTA